MSYLHPNPANQSTPVSISGQPVLISGQTVVASVTTNISGQTVYLVSGQNPVQLYAFDPSGNALRPLIVNQSGGNVLRVDAGAINVTSNISGQTVYLVSGHNEVIANVNTTTNISGQIVYLVSGQNDVQMSGQTVRIASVSGDLINAIRPYSGVAIPTSGFALLTKSIIMDNEGEIPVVNATDADSFITSDKALMTHARLFGYDITQDRFARLRVTSSGQGVSGINHRLVVAFSGDPVSISGQAIRLVSGDTISVIIRDSAGDFANVRLPDDDSVGMTVHGLDTISHLYGYYEAASGFARLRVTNSGDGYKLAVSVSGQPVIVASTSISGNAVTISGNVVLISGQLVAVSGLVATSISGNMVSVSGQPVRISGSMVSISGQPVNVSGNVVNTSGNSAFEYGTAIRTNVPTVIASLSGGTELSSGVVFSVTIRNASGNAPMWIGGATGTDVPNSGKGMILFGNESQTYKLDNFNKVRAFARTSGQLLYFTGVDK